MVLFQKKLRQEYKRGFAGLVFSYIKHFVKANSKYGIHSPFVYRLVTDCIFKKISSAEFEFIENHRKRLRADKSKIPVNEFGAKNNGIAGKKDTISRIARNSLKSSKQAKLLYKVADYFECNNILELGTSFGITTSYLCKARPDALVNSIEGNSKVAGMANNIFESLELKNIRLHIGDIDNLLIPVLENIDAPDLIFLDANHTKNATIKYFNILIDYIDDNSLLIIDDIYWSNGMEKAWNEICDHHKVSVTVDLFYMGLVFFKKGLSKENFIIRY